MWWLAEGGRRGRLETTSLLLVCENGFLALVCFSLFGPASSERASCRGEKSAGVVFFFLNVHKCFSSTNPT